MVEPTQRAWHFYVDDMIRCAEKVLAYTDSLDQQQFIAGSLHYDATLRNLALLGEAATHLPADVRAANPPIPWRLIIATWNRRIHDYLGIDNDVVWSIVQAHVPVLLRQLHELRARST